ncbi:adenylosuccinate lyase [Verrucomicrobiales bacterium]|nr:adenylosuccinate lyase [Verrucomicrobiales bacterium]MDC0322695.1 adenylosuccinate lyase [Verrucomicrobiales bacterium]
MIPNVLAERYATASIRDIWSPEGKVRLERELWVAVMKGQRDLGLDIPAEAIEAYEAVIDQIDVDSINARERVTKHDVKARIEEFCDLAGHEHIHKGMTSRDLTENVEQLQVFRSLAEIRFKTAAVLAKLAKRADEFRDLVITARTHNVAAQITTYGKRLATFGEEIQIAFDALEHLIATYPVRGLKGAVGTQLDQLSLFDGDSEKVLELESRVAGHLGIARKFTNVGQVYPRSLDLQVVAALNGIASGPSSFAKTLRLMAGHELASEGFAKGQVGSSAMPHKMNSRSCERINGFKTILGGYLTMASSLAGDQWNEGDVSCSVVRRVMLPDAFFAVDGLLETLVTILNQMDAYPAVIELENRHYLPFLLSTTIMMTAVKRGVGRETAHEVIKEHAVAAAGAYRTGETERNDLIERLANDGRLGMTKDELEAALTEGKANAGAADAQVSAFLARVAENVAGVEGAAEYEPGSIL